MNLFLIRLQSFRVIHLFPAMLLASCGVSSAPDTTADDLSSLKSEIASLRSDLWNRTYDPQTTAWLTPTEQSFSFLNTEIGPLAFSVQDIKAKGDGSELTLKIGNPTTATITFLKFHAEWGHIDKADLFIEGQSREGDKNVTSPLLPGTWNVITLSFAGVPPGRMGRVELSKPKITNISLRSL